MAINTIDKLRAKDEGYTDFVVCPECEKYISMRLFYLDDRSKVASLKNENKDMCIAVCPSCASVFSVNENYYKERKSGTTVYLTESDLKKIVTNKPGKNNA